MDKLAQILDWVSNVGLVVLALAVLLWLISYRRLPWAIRYLGLYLFLNLIIQIVADQLWQRSMNNLPLLHLNTLLEFVLISLFFKEVYIGQDWFKKNALYIITGISLLVVLNSFFLEIPLEPNYNYNSNAATLVQVCLIAYVIIYFFDAFGKVDYSRPYEQSIGILCFAVFLYFSGSLFVFMFNRFFTNENSEYFELFWIYNACLTVIFQLLSLIGIVIIVLNLYSRKPSEFIERN